MYFIKHFNKKSIFPLIVIAILIFTLAGYTKIRAEESKENKVFILAKNIDGTPGIFNDNDGFWYPGRTLSKQFVIKNGNTEEIEFSKISVKIQSVNQFLLNKLINPDEEIYKEFLKNFKVQLKDGENILFDDTFENFNKNGVPLKESIKIAGGSEKEFQITLHFEEKAGNMLQDLQNLFNLSIEYILKDGGSTKDPVTDLPQTGGAYNFITLVVMGVPLIGLGFLFLWHKDERTSGKGGINNAK